MIASDEAWFQQLDDWETWQDHPDQQTPINDFEQEQTGETF